MGEKKEYRSAIRSRKLIRQALFELLKEKPFEKITVTDIVTRAEINRSTFYAHYPDVMGVIEEIEDEILEYSESSIGAIEFGDFFENPLPYLEKMIELVRNHVEFYRLLTTSSMGAKQMESIKKVLIERAMKTANTPEFYRSTREFEFSVRFFMGGIVDVYLQWMRGEIDCTLEVLTEQLAKYIQTSNDVHLRMMIELQKKQEEGNG